VAVRLVALRPARDVFRPPALGLVDLPRVEGFLRAGADRRLEDLLRAEPRPEDVRREDARPEVERPADLRFVEAFPAADPTAGSA
jgi:hypothetical protein